MRRILHLIFAIGTIILLSSCATSYRSIKPENFLYPESISEDGIALSYKYDVLRSSGNKRYAEKEINQRMRLIAIKITNQSDSTFCLNRDCEFYAGNVKILPMETSSISDRLKQKVWPYYFYMLLTFTRLTYSITTPTSVSTGSLPIGYVLGPGITLLNVFKASNANRNLFINLQSTDVWNRKIQKGETVYGLIGIDSRDFVPIHIKKK